MNYFNDGFYDNKLHILHGLSKEVLSKQFICEENVVS